ncbi:hypothetical protein D9Q98_009778 [Chlorella vulgaris]|uniref:Uncharacterized protein n=1 Tax=Chlorella vulgaris TaxID=3077 RepID=A0A9D4TF14_CHLVU|nr:hypothetical protein D9Q98_009778 [Chlorella vulgaris]
MESVDAWNDHLRVRIEDELVGMARLSLLGGDLVRNSLTDRVSEELRMCLRRHLKPASNNNKNLKKHAQLHALMKVAIVAALKEFRDNLPTILPALVDEYITEVVTEPLFVEVRTARHPIAQAVLQPARAPAAAVGAAVARHGPCLWRCIYYFYQTVMSSAAPLQVEARQAATAQLQEFIRQLNVFAPGPAAPAAPQADPAAEPPAAPAAPHANPVAQPSAEAAAAAPALTHRAAQRGKLAQVLPAQVRPLAFKLTVRTADDHPDGRTINLHRFLANSRNLDFPAPWAQAPADDERAVQQLFDRVASYSLYIRPDCIPPLAPDNALIAARSGMTGTLLIWDDWRGAALRDVIAAEAQRNPLDGRDYDPQDIARWAGLLELTYLAQASHRNFIVFTAQTSPTSTTGRSQAFIVPDGVRVGAAGHESEEPMYPLAMILRKDRGHTRTWFMPLFLDKQRPDVVSERRARAGGAGSSASMAPLGGAEEQAIRALARLADEAALTRLGAEDRAVGGSAGKRPRVSE